MSVHSFLDGVALAAGLAVGGGLGARDRGRRDRPPVQRRDLGREPAPRRPDARARGLSLGVRRRDRPGARGAARRHRADLGRRPWGDAGDLCRVLPVRRRRRAAARSAPFEPLALGRAGHSGWRRRDLPFLEGDGAIG